MTSIEFDGNFNAGAMEEKIKGIQRDLQEMKHKHEDNGKKLDQLIIEQAKSTQSSGIIIEMFKEISLKNELNSGHIIMLQNEFKNLKAIVDKNTAIVMTVGVLQNNVCTIQDRGKQNAQMIRGIIIIVLGQVVGLFFGFFK